MDESILTSIKEPLGIADENTSFDKDVVMAINTALMALNQLGVGPTTGLSISDKSTKWSALLETRTDLEGVKTYIQLKTRLAFDPPQSSPLIEAIKEQIRELEFRILIQVEGGTTSG